MRYGKVVLLVISFILLFQSIGHTAPGNFDQNNQADLYCSCQWDWRGRSVGSISSQQATSYGLNQSYQPTRTKLTEWEHIFAVSNAENHFQCCLARGNRRSGVYHLASGCPSYHSTSNTNIVEFDDKQAALSSGLRKGGNYQ